MELKKMFWLLFSLLILFTSCSKNKMEENEEELITTLKLAFVPSGGGAVLNYQFDDPDGPGGTIPSQDEIVLSSSKSYFVTVQLLNKTKSPAEDITLELQNEAASHRFYYEPGTGSNITVSALNNDDNGVPLGITSTWATGNTASGKIKITLRHYPGNPPDKAIIDPVNSSKSGTDISIEFTTKIQ